MPESWILNASPLIALAKIGHVDLFSRLADRVVVPDAVAREIQSGPPEDNARRVVESGQLVIVEVPAAPPELVAWDLGEGETAVLSLALARKRWIAILDDAAARKCARSFSLEFKGTLAVVILARLHGFIPSAGDLIRALRANGFRIDDRIVRTALQQTVGEEWPST